MNVRLKKIQCLAFLSVLIWQGALFSGDLPRETSNLYKEKVSAQDVRNFLLSLSSEREIYQDIFIQGKVVKKGVRLCESRYQAIRKFCKQYHRPITVLDLGANYGYFSFRLAEEFPGTFVMLEGWTKDSLKKLCEFNDTGKCILLSKLVTLRDLQDLADVEHFDVVLGLSVIHHLNEPWQKVLDTLVQLGDHLILEVPSLKERICDPKRVAYNTIDLSKYQVQCISQTPSHLSAGVQRNLYAISCPKNSLKKGFWQTLAPTFVSPMIRSSFDAKTVAFPHKDEKERAWIHGLNFSTFLALKGTFPQKQNILSMLNKIQLMPYLDLRPWNLILTGSDLRLIDLNHVNGVRYAPAVSQIDLKEMIKLYEKDELAPNNPLQWKRW